MAKRDYYEVLEVEKTADQAAVKAAYRRLVKQYHPDLNPGDKTAEEKMKEVNEAYEVLSDEKKRAQYDQFGHQEPGGNPYGQGGFEGGFGGFGFEDIIGNIFGGGFGGRSRTNGPIDGDDLRQDITITLEEALPGTTREIRFARKATCDECHGTGAQPGTKVDTCSECKGTGQVRTVTRTPFGAMQQVGACPKCRGTGKIIQTPCQSCRGSGTVRKNRNIELKIHPGADNGQRIPIRGEGEPGQRGGQHGDLYIYINIKHHPVFQRKEHNLYCTVSVPYTAAALGLDIEIPSIEGKTITTKLKPGTQPGEVLRLNGQGMPVPGAGTRRGGLFATVQIAVPRNLTEAERKALSAYHAASTGVPAKKGRNSKFR